MTAEKPGKRKELENLQAWFGGAISRPLPDEYSGNPLAVSVPDLEKEAAALLNGKGDLSGFARLGVYNQQYWFRLISIMQSEYSCAVHLIGLREFNQWAIRYLDAYPPSSPFLAELDAHFPAFMEAHYRKDNREAALQAIAYDRAFSKVFDAPEALSLAKAGLSDPGAIISRRLTLAPHASALRISYDFAAYRVLCLGDETLEESFPLVPEESNLFIYRDADLDIQVEPLSSAALAVLSEFAEPALLGEVFERLEGKLTPMEQSELESSLAAWFQEWVAQGWLCLADGEN